MKLQSIAVSVACISLAGIGFGFSLIVPQRANATPIQNESVIYGEYLPHWGINLLV